MKFLILAVCSFLLVVTIGCNKHKKEIEEIGYNLVKLAELDSIETHHPNFAVPNVVNVGPGLFQKLKDSDYDYTKIRLQVSIGDASPPIGDGGAQYRLTITENAANKPITIRLKYNSEYGKYDILGYYSGLSN